jgi:hypothetical protein
VGNHATTLTGHDGDGVVSLPCGGNDKSALYSVEIISPALVLGVEVMKDCIEPRELHHAGRTRDVEMVDIFNMLEKLGRVRCSNAARRRSHRRCRLIGATDPIKTVLLAAGAVRRPYNWSRRLISDNDDMNTAVVFRRRRRGRWRRDQVSSQVFKNRLIGVHSNKIVLRAAGVVRRPRNWSRRLISGTDDMCKVVVFRRRRRGRWRRDQVSSTVVRNDCSVHYGLIRGRIIRHPDNDR